MSRTFRTRRILAVLAVLAAAVLAVPRFLTHVPYQRLGVSLDWDNPDGRPRVFEVVGPPEEVDAFEELVRPHGLKELVRTGRIGLGRASVKRSPVRQHVLR